MNHKLNLTVKKKGFTLVEVLVIIAILSILSTITIIGYTNFIHKAAISNDTSLANQVNKLLQGYCITEKMTSYDSISEMLKNNIDFEIDIQTKDINMNIYYNDDNEQFELMDNNEMYYTLEEIMNWEDKQGDNSDSLSNAYKTSLKVNSSYKKDTYVNPENLNSQNLKARINNNNNLDIELYINEERNPISPEIDISKLITATDSSNKEITLTYDYNDITNIITGKDSSGNLLEIQYEFTPIDLIEYNKLHDKNVDFDWTANGLKIYTAGKYRINYTYKNQEIFIDINVKNVYLGDIASITVDDDIKHEFDDTKIHEGIVTLNILSKDLLKIKDYATDNNTIGNIESVTINQRHSYMYETSIIVCLNSKYYEVQMVNLKIDNNRYYFIIEDLDIESVKTLTIQYRYQALNGEYLVSQIYTIK